VRRGRSVFPKPHNYVHGTLYAPRFSQFDKRRQGDFKTPPFDFPDQFGYSLSKHHKGVGRWEDVEEKAQRKWADNTGRLGSRARRDLRPVVYGWLSKEARGQRPRVF
jgi:hypothetical protein